MFFSSHISYHYDNIKMHLYKNLHDESVGVGTYMIYIGLILCISIVIVSIAYQIGKHFFWRAFDVRSDKSKFMIRDLHKKLKDEDIWFLNKSKHETISVQSEDGFRLQGYAIPNNTNTWIILVHGYIGRSEDMIPAAKRFYDLGYAVLLIDLRGHGKSEGDVIGFGALDQVDLTLWCDFLRNERDAKQLILYGVSMGAATVMMKADTSDQDIIAIIEDCGFTDLHSQLHVIVKKIVPKVPSGFLIACLQLVLKHKAGYKLKDANPIIHVQNATKPMLFIHGERDGFIPIAMMEELYKVCPTQKKVLRIEKGRHAMCALYSPKEYWEGIEAFLHEVLAS